MAFAVLTSERQSCLIVTTNDRVQKLLVILIIMIYSIKAALPSFSLGKTTYTVLFLENSDIKGCIIDSYIYNFYVRPIC